MNWLLERLGLTPTPNAVHWPRKWTTRLSALQMGFLALIALYVTLHEDLQHVVPRWALIVVVAGAAVTTFATVVAANARQEKLAQPPVRYPDDKA